MLVIGVKLCDWTCVRTHTCTYVCIHVCVSLCISTITYVYMCIARACVYACEFMFVCPCAHLQRTPFYDSAVQATQSYPKGPRQDLQGYKQSIIPLIININL
uniref:Uncharacterized protein n=1 Tax=Anguilla anguilla TaxID=7936 RepID=A0A0E9R9E1_ANGAN